MAEPFVPLGEIVTTHGLNGWLKLNSYNPDTTTLSRGVEVVLEKAGERSVHQLEASRGRRKQWLVKLQQVDSFDEAVKYVGSTVSISADALVEMLRELAAELHPSRTAIPSSLDARLDQGYGFDSLGRV